MIGFDAKKSANIVNRYQIDGILIELAEFAALPYWSCYPLTWG